MRNRLCRTFSIGVCVDISSGYFIRKVSVKALEVFGSPYCRAPRIGLSVHTVNPSSPYGSLHGARLSSSKPRGERSLHHPSIIFTPPCFSLPPSSSRRLVVVPMVLDQWASVVEGVDV